MSKFAKILDYDDKILGSIFQLSLFFMHETPVRVN